MKNENSLCDLIYHTGHGRPKHACEACVEDARGMQLLESFVRSGKLTQEKVDHMVAMKKEILSKRFEAK